MDFIHWWMAALPPPGVGGGADRPPQLGRDGSVVTFRMALLIEKFTNIAMDVG